MTLLLHHAFLVPLITLNISFSIVENFILKLDRKFVHMERINLLLKVTLGIKKFNESLY